MSDGFIFNLVKSYSDGSEKVLGTFKNPSNAMKEKEMMEGLTLNHCQWYTVEVERRVCDE